LDGGIDFILIETVFDTLNAKAAIVAVDEAGEARGEVIPGDGVSMTPDESCRPQPLGPDGRGLLAFGAPCQAAHHGAELQLRGDRVHPYVNALNPQVDGLVCVYPNAGLPNELGAYDEPPEMTAKLVKGWAAEAGWLNVVGGCCGTTPAHIKAVAEAVKGLKPRQWHALPPALRFERHGSGEFFSDDSIRVFRTAGLQARS